jgi:hypothetical protein
MMFFKQHTPRNLLVLIICWLSISCSQTIQTEYDYRPEVDFSQFSQYSFLPFASQGSETIDQSRIKQALSQALSAKGLQAVPEDQADVLIAYHVFTETKQKQRLTSTGGNYYYGRRYYGQSINMGTTVIEQIDYKLGHLVVDFISPDERKVLYHAEAAAQVGDVKTPQQRTKLIQQAVDEMLAQYPPESKP